MELCTVIIKNNSMNTQPATIRIASIIFDNADTKVLIKGETFKGHLSYMSEMFISFTELNTLLNQLQRQNPDISVSDLFNEEYLGNDYFQTVLDAEQLENQQVDLSFLSFGSLKKLIRA